jgi:putative transposase
VLNAAGGRLPEPYDGKRHVRFDEGALETERWARLRHRHVAKAAGNSHPSHLMPPRQRPTLQHRNLLAHAPERLHEEITADYNDMIYAASREEVEARRKAFIRKWRLKHRAVADSLEEAGDRLFTFTRLPPSQWRSARTTNAVERLHEEFKRRIKTQTVLPSADTAAMLFWALLASGQINMRKIDGWQTLATKPIDQQIDLAA